MVNNKIIGKIINENLVNKFIPVYLTANSVNNNNVKQ
jgi:hypothetical protein